MVRTKSAFPLAGPGRFVRRAAWRRPVADRTSAWRRCPHPVLPPPAWTRPLACVRTGSTPSSDEHEQDQRGDRQHRRGPPRWRCLRPRRSSWWPRGESPRASRPATGHEGAGRLPLAEARPLGRPSPPAGRRASPLATLRSSHHGPRRRQGPSRTPAALMWRAWVRRAWARRPASVQAAPKGLPPVTPRPARRGLAPRQPAWPQGRSGGRGRRWHPRQARRDVPRGARRPGVPSRCESGPRSPGAPVASLLIAAGLLGDEVESWAAACGAESAESQRAGIWVKGTAAQAPAASSSGPAAGRRRRAGGTPRAALADAARPPNPPQADGAARLRCVDRGFTALSWSSPSCTNGLGAHASDACAAAVGLHVGARRRGVQLCGSSLRQVRAQLPRSLPFVSHYSAHHDVAPARSRFPKGAPGVCYSAVGMDSCCRVRRCRGVCSFWMHLGHCLYQVMLQAHGALIGSGLFTHRDLLC